MEVVYEDMGQKDLQEFINNKAMEENGVLRTILTIYERSKKKNVNNIKSFDSNLNNSLGVFCHMLVFEKRKDNDDEEKFTMVFQGNKDFDMDPSKKINEFLYQEELCQKFRIGGYLPKTTFEESLFIFSV